jgi:hypothetical protein
MAAREWEIAKRKKTISQKPHRYPQNVQPTTLIIVWLHDFFCLIVPMGQHRTNL